MTRIRWVIFAIAALATAWVTNPARAEPLTADNIAIVINPNDPDSVAVGRYYADRLGITMKIMAPIAFSNYQVTYDVYKPWAAGINAALAGKTKIKVVLLSFRNPQRVECDGLTTALAMGMQRTSSCSSTSYSDPTLTGAQMYNPLYGWDGNGDIPSIATRPDGTGRLVATIAGRDVKTTVEAVERAIAADGTNPAGTVYVRNDKADNFSQIWGYDYLSNGAPMQFGPIKVEYFSGGGLKNKTGVLGYFTEDDGMKNVIPAIPTNTYLPGLYTNLDSFCGLRQNGFGCEDMLQYMAASVGTVSEPYAMASKFVRPWRYAPMLAAGKEQIVAAWAGLQVPLNSLVMIPHPLGRPFGPKVPVFAAKTPPYDPCLASIAMVVDQPTSIAVGTKVPFTVVDASGKTIVDNSTPVLSGGKIAPMVKGTATVSGPLTFTADGKSRQLCTAMVDGSPIPPAPPVVTDPTPPIVTPPADPVPPPVEQQPAPPADPTPPATTPPATTPGLKACPAPYTDSLKLTFTVPVAGIAAGQKMTWKVIQADGSTLKGSSGYAPDKIPAAGWSLQISQNFPIPTVKGALSVVTVPGTTTPICNWQ